MRETGARMSEGLWWWGGGGGRESEREREMEKERGRERKREREREGEFPFPPGVTTTKAISLNSRLLILTWSLYDWPPPRRFFFVKSAA